MMVENEDITWEFLQDIVVLLKKYEGRIDPIVMSLFKDAERLSEQYLKYRGGY